MRTFKLTSLFDPCYFINAHSKIDIMIKINQAQALNIIVIKYIKKKKISFKTHNKRHALQSLVETCLDVLRVSPTCTSVIVLP